MGTQDQGRKLKHTAGQRANRQYRRLLGLCYECQRPALPEKIRCEYHLPLNRANKARYRERRAQARGFKYTKVPIGGVE
jgi:hypothetical protein